MDFHPTAPPPEVLAFLAERHIATLTTTNDEGHLQVTPVGFTYEPDRSLARVITWAEAVKVRNIDRHGRHQVALCQVDGGRWLTLYGNAVVTDDASAVSEGVARYRQRYRPPGERNDRVVIEITVERIIGRV